MDLGKTHGSRLSMELGLLAALALYFHGALAWIVGTWSDATYESWGFVALGALLLRRLPARRAAPSRPHLWGIGGVMSLELVCAPLQLNVLSALLAVVGLHLWAVTFRAYPGRWFAQAQLWLGLLCLPAVYWINVLAGYHLQHLVTRLAAAGLGFYGLPVSSSGTLLELPSLIMAVDSSCSGLKLLYTGVLFGVLATPASAAGPRRVVLFWGGLIGLLFAANVMRVMSLAAAHLHLGQPVSEAAHQGIGLMAFATVCALALWLARALERPPRCGCRHRPATCAGGR